METISDAILKMLEARRILAGLRKWSTTAALDDLIEEVRAERVSDARAAARDRKNKKASR